MKDIAQETEVPERSSLHLFKGTSVVAVLTLVSRALGFVRDALVARLFGTSPFADAFFVAFRIPNLLRSLVAEGALTSAFVPVFNDELKKSKQAANQALTSIAFVLIGVCTILAIAGVLFSSNLIDLFAPGFAQDPAQFALASTMLQIMLPIILFVAIVALVNGALNSVGVFGSGAWAQIVMNIVLILGALTAAFFDLQTAAFLLSGSVLLGAVCQVLVQLPALRRAGFTARSKEKFSWLPVRAVFRLLPPAIIGATVYQLEIFLITVLSSLCGPGAVSWMFYSDRIVQLPIGVYTIALSSVLLAVLSKARAEADSKTFSRELNKALSLSLFLLMPLSAGLVMYAEPIVRLVFMRGAFTASDAHSTAAIVAVSAIGLLPISLQSIFSRVFIAHKDTVTTTLLGMFTLCITLTVGLGLMGPIDASHGEASGWIVSLQQHLPHLGSLGVQGLNWACVIATTVSCLSLAILLVLRYDVSFRQLLPSIGRSGLATLVFVLVSYAGMHFGLIFFAAILASAAWLLVHFCLKGTEVTAFRTILKRKK